MCKIAVDGWTKRYFLCHRIVWKLQAAVAPVIRSKSSIIFVDAEAVLREYISWGSGKQCIGKITILDTSTRSFG